MVDIIIITTVVVWSTETVTVGVGGATDDRN